ncbi:hypothetical protein EUGRSUZ_K03159 [Eucalyptus grandis]|uniref:Uncharacterized protein n=2 Tax=Eucalyptus grandis TaxID=71139 RepID=A0A059A8E6_EUCGR|nr:hypothetical protein EUGRSUZ_K03159 [Eucalyptus grandis]
MGDCSCTSGTNSVVCENLISELGNTLGNVLHVEDGEVAVGTSKVEKSQGVSGLNAKSDQKRLVKCVTFPLPGEKLSPPLFSDKEYDEPESALRELFSEEHINNVYSRSISFPTSSKLVSALKGTREKQDASPRKLTVRWAPDVYDPPPTSVSHFLNRGTKQQKVPKKDKRNGKRGQKGKDFSRGASGKDSSKRDKKDKKKKQSRRPSVSLDRCLNKLDDNDRRLGIADDVRQFDIGNPVPDSSCGSSFFNNSLSQLHYSAAEAS